MKGMGDDLQSLLLVVKCNQHRPEQRQHDADRGGIRTTILQLLQQHLLYVFWYTFDCLQQELVAFLQHNSTIDDLPYSSWGGKANARAP